MLRFFDVILSTIGLLILFPVFLIISIWIKFDSPGPIYYRQIRVGFKGNDFKLLKFRSMFLNSDKKGLITIGLHDNRVTQSGYFIRKLKLDELPQLINVLMGDMSLVGPRPEVRKYVEMYSDDQKKILSVKPGITDYSSIFFRNENELLANSPNPEEYYIQHIIPEKIRLNMIFISNRNLNQYFKIIFLTILTTSRLVNKSDKV